MSISSTCEYTLDGELVSKYLVWDQAWQAHSRNYQTQRQSTRLHNVCIQADYPAHIEHDIVKTS